MKTNKISLKRQIKNLNDLVAMKCLECSNCQIKEVLLCEIKGCPLWKNRPNKAKGLYILVRHLKQNNSKNFEANDL